MEQPITVLSSAAAGLGLWWIILGVIVLMFPGLPGAVFRPFFARSAWKRGAMLIFLGLLFTLGGAITLTAWLS